MPIWDSGPTIDGGGIPDPYSQPPKDPITGVPPSGGAFNPISGSGNTRAILSVLEQRISLPNIGAMIGIYDPEVAALLAGES